MRRHTHKLPSVWIVNAHAIASIFCSSGCGYVESHLDGSTSLCQAPLRVGSQVGQSSTFLASLIPRPSRFIFVPPADRRFCFHQRSTALFKLLDTDNNGLIDAIEFVSAMACASGE